MGKTTLEDFGFLFCLGPIATPKHVLLSVLTGAHSLKLSPGSPNRCIAPILLTQICVCSKYDLEVNGTSS